MLHWWSLGDGATYINVQQEMEPVVWVPTPGARESATEPLVLEVKDKTSYTGMLKRRFDSLQVPLRVTLENCQVLGLGQSALSVSIVQ